MFTKLSSATKVSAGLMILTATVSAQVFNSRTLSKAASEIEAKSSRVIDKSENRSSVLV